MAVLNSNILSKTLTADGSVYASRARVKGIFASTTTAGSIVLKNGGASGTTLLDVSIGANFSGNIYIPNDGILFESDVYLDLTNATSVTVFYQA